MAKSRRKRPSRAHTPDQSKTPRVQASDTSVPFRWCTKYADVSDQEWGWGRVSIQEVFHDLLVHLYELEGSTWGDLRRDHSSRIHEIPSHRIVKSAQDRLVSLTEHHGVPGDMIGGDLVSIRRTSRARIWGFKSRGVLYLLWWDPCHSVYPVSKQHT